VTLKTAGAVVIARSASRRDPIATAVRGNFEDENDTKVTPRVVLDSNVVVAGSSRMLHTEAPKHGTQNIHLLAYEDRPCFPCFSGSVW
jgi:hypothetical protein